MNSVNPHEFWVCGWFPWSELLPVSQSANLFDIIHNLSHDAMLKLFSFPHFFPPFFLLHGNIYCRGCEEEPPACCRASSSCGLWKLLRAVFNLPLLPVTLYLLYIIYMSYLCISEERHLKLVMQGCVCLYVRCLIADMTWGVVTGWHALRNAFISATHTHTSTAVPLM